MIVTICAATADILNVAGLSFNLTDRRLAIGESDVPLTAKEYAFVELLALRAGEIVTKVDVMAHLYDAGSEPDAKILDVFICKARRKLRAANAGVDPVATIWGRGYLVAA